MFSASFVRKYWFVFIVSLVLFIIPFFWLKHGEIDLGGDSTRLYFYDPISFIKSTGIYDIFSQGKGRVEPNYYYIPFVSLLALLKAITFSPTTLINIFNGVKLAGGFLGIYLIVRELLSKAKNKDNLLINWSAILAGLFYTVSFGSFNIGFFWERAIMSHNQIFLNPLVFFFLLKFFLTKKYKYLSVALILSFIFSPNFGLTSAPPFFAFYPIALLFLFFYIRRFGRRSISRREVFVALLFFLGVQAFQMLPQAISLFDKGSFTNSKVFSKEEIEAGGVTYFSSVSPHGKAILNLLLPSGRIFFNVQTPLGSKLFILLSLTAPLMVAIGFLLGRERKKEYLLISSFFVVTFFLSTANITSIGYEFYRRLFYIPGFSMFRNFYTQWLYVFIFFYSLLLGFSAFNILSKLKPYYRKLLPFLVFVSFAIAGFPLFSGGFVNKSTIRGSNNIKTSFVMDPLYEKTFRFIRSLPDDGKILVLPLTDSYRQVIFGKDGLGAYEGPSTISYLAKKYSFTGYQDFGYGINIPYAEDIMRYSREKNYGRLLKIFNLLNIRYILHNNDPRAYEKNFFEQSSYGYMQTSMPKTQALYREFISHFPVSVIYQNGPYIVYEIDKSIYNPTIFSPDGVYVSNKISYEENRAHSVFINNSVCKNLIFKDLCSGEYKKPDMDIKFKIIDLTKYIVTIKVNKPSVKLFLVMQNIFHDDWKLVKNDKLMAQDAHVQANGYANGWLISGKDLSKTGTYTFYIKLDPQKYLWYGSTITGLSLIILIMILITSFKKNDNN